MSKSKFILDNLEDPTDPWIVNLYKQNKALNKRLKQIQDLEKTPKDSLNKDQLEKIHRRAEITEQKQELNHKYREYVDIVKGANDQQKQQAQQQQVPVIQEVVNNDNVQLLINLVLSGLHNTHNQTVSQFFNLLFKQSIEKTSNVEELNKVSKLCLDSILSVADKQNEVAFGKHTYADIHRELTSSNLWKQLNDSLHHSHNHNHKHNHNHHHQQKHQKEPEVQQEKQVQQVQQTQQKEEVAEVQQQPEVQKQQEQPVEQQQQEQQQQAQPEQEDQQGEGVQQGEKQVEKRRYNSNNRRGPQQGQKRQYNNNHNNHNNHNNNYNNNNNNKTQYRQKSSGNQGEGQHQRSPRTRGDYQQQQKQDDEGFITVQKPGKKPQNQSGGSYYKKPYQGNRQGGNYQQGENYQGGNYQQGGQRRNYNNTRGENRPQGQRRSPTGRNYGQRKEQQPENEKQQVEQQQETNEE